MKSMSSNDNSGNNKNSDNWLGFSLSPHSSETTQPCPSNPTTFFGLPSHFNYQNTYCGGAEGVNGGGMYSAFPIMPLKSDGSLCLMDAITRSQSQGIVGSTPPKPEKFFGGVTIGTPDLDRRATMALNLGSSTMYYHQNLDHETLHHNNRNQQYQIQPQHYQDYSGLYQTVQQEESTEPQIAADGTCSLYLPTIGEGQITTGMKDWISTNYHSGGGGDGGAALQSLSLSMSPGCSQSSSCVTGSQQQIIPAANVTDCVIMDTKKRVKVDQPKQIVHRKSLDTFGQRTSQYRGVTRHRWTGRYEAHLWDNSCKKEGQSRKGRQVYLGGYDMEEKAARAYDLAALKYWGPSTHINFPLENYEQELQEMKNMSRQEYVAHLRRRSSGFSRGASVYRGVTRHHQHGRWQARIGRVAGNKDLYLGTFSTQEDAAEAYDVAAIKFRGVNAVTNFDISRYNVEKIIASHTLLAGELARRTKEVDTTSELLQNQSHNGEPRATLSETAIDGNMLDWKMAVYDQNSVDASEGDESSRIRTHLSNGGSSLVTSLSSSREDSSPERNNNLPMVVLGTPTATTAALLRPRIPIFAAWTDA